MRTTSVITVLLVLILIGVGLYYVNRNPTTPDTNTNVTATTTNTSTPTTTSGTTSGTTSATTTSNVAVAIRNFAYAPATLTIKRGTRVTWTNNDTAPHDVTSVTGTVLNSPRLTTGQSFSYTFNQTGTFNYYCTIHPNMRATVIVTD